MSGALLLCRAVLTEPFGSANVKQEIGMQIQLSIFLAETCPGSTCTNTNTRESSQVNTLPDSRRMLRGS